MGPIADTAVATFGDTIAVEIGNIVAYDLGTKLANDLIADKTAKGMISVHSARLETTSVKAILITLKFKHTMSDAALGFFRSGTVHQDGDLFTDIKDYLSVEKGWLGPYLFASSRRPVIPRSIKPDIIFCHGPFLWGDYRIPETILAESASIIKLCLDFPTEPAPTGAEPTRNPTGLIVRSQDIIILAWICFSNTLNGKETLSVSAPNDVPNIQGDRIYHSSNPSTISLPASIPTSRHILVAVLGISPHRRLWTSSARPGESVINYHLLNGCPALVLPAVSVKGSTPLLAWDTLTLEHLHIIGKKKGRVHGEVFKGVVTCLFEYLSLCVEWYRVVIPEEVTNPVESAENGEDFKKQVVRAGIELVVAGAIRSHDSKAVKVNVDTNRARIVMLRMP